MFLERIFIFIIWPWNLSLLLFDYQVAKSTAVADEALGNVRTVRAFAMEEKEHE